MIAARGALQFASTGRCSIGVTGFFGGNGVSAGGIICFEATQHRILKAYQKAFPDKQLMARYADGVLAKYKGIGFHDDMFPEDTDNGEDWSFLARMRQAVMLTAGNRTWSAAKWCRTALKWLGNEWAYTREMVGRSRAWIGLYGPALDENVSLNLQARSDQLVERWVVNFDLTEVRHSRVALEKVVLFWCEG